ncbi:MAG: phosphoribosylanthranilate isomerase [Cellvibrionaceae bacterium]
MSEFQRVKICGITSVDDAVAVCGAGADAIGLVFYAKSPRNVSIEIAAEIARSVGPYCTVVGLFVNAEAEFVNRVLGRVGLHVLQFHGDETDEYCRQFQRPFYKAIRMKEDLDVNVAMAKFPSAVAILLDAYRPGVPGGTGETFDWQRVPREAKLPIVLAGGLTPDNVSSAVSATEVYGVDVSGGVEAQPGKKDSEKVRAFLRRAKAENTSD